MWAPEKLWIICPVLMNLCPMSVEMAAILEDLGTIWCRAGEWGMVLAAMVAQLISVREDGLTVLAPETLLSLRFWLGWMLVWWIINMK